LSYRGSCAHTLARCCEQVKIGMCRTSASRGTPDMNVAGAAPAAPATPPCSPVDLVRAGSGSADRWRRVPARSVGSS